MLLKLKKRAVLFYHHHVTNYLQERSLVQKFYPDGSIFLIHFPDGTGTVLYPLCVKRGACEVLRHVEMVVVT